MYFIKVLPAAKLQIEFDDRNCIALRILQLTYYALQPPFYS